jgi:hypothetical protein
MASPIKRPLHPEDQLFFIHVPKTAGTSFISLLDEIFIDSEICPTHYDLRRFGGEISDEMLNGYKFLRGHLPYNLIVPRLNKMPRIITFLRDPVAQFISYFRMRKRETDPISGFQTKDVSLAEFVEGAEIEVLSNNITKLFAGSEDFFSSGKNQTATPTDYYRLGHGDLNLAKERLATCEFIGITEQFDQSVKLFNYIFGFPIPPQHREMNVAPGRERGARVEKATLNKIAEIQYADLELYSYGKQLFKQLRNKVRLETLAAKVKSDATEMQSLALRKVTQKVRFDFRRVPPGAGWQVGENHPTYKIIRWSGPDKISKLLLPIYADQDLVVKFNVIKWMSDEILESLELFVNGQEIPLEQDRIQGEEVVVHGVIKKGRLKKPGLVEFLLKVSDVSRPSDINPNNPDSRNLGLCYNWLTVEPAAATA